MIELETFLIFLTTTIATLMGFSGVIFIFWYEIKKEGPYGVIPNTPENRKIVHRFKWLVYIAMFVIYFSIGTVLLFTACTNVPNLILILFLAISSIIWISYLGFGFFMSIHSDIESKIPN